MNKLAQYIKEAQSILLITHFCPDGDAIGSMFALEEALRGLHKEVMSVIQGKVNDKFNNICDIHKRLPNKRYDLLIVLDCHNVNRFYTQCLDYAEKSICIDHHHQSGYDCKFDYIYNKKAAACCIWVYKLIKLLDISITSHMATLLYMGIRTDTNNFTNDGTDYNAFAVCADLMNYNCDLKSINGMHDINANLLKLLNLCLDTLIIDYKYKYISMYVSQTNMYKCNVSYQEARELIEYIRHINNIDISLLFIEDNGKIRIRARSTQLNVNHLMQKFNGGGHSKAAGGFIYEDCNQIFNEIKKMVDN